MEAVVLLWLRPHPCQRLELLPGNSFTVLLIPRAAVLPRPLQNLQVPRPSSAPTRRRIPRAVVFPCPSQHLKMPTTSGPSARHRIPRAVVLPHPPQHLQVPAPSDERTGPRNPRAAARLGPCQPLDGPDEVHEPMRHHPHHQQEPNHPSARSRAQQMGGLHRLPTCAPRLREEGAVDGVQVL